MFDASQRCQQVGSVAGRGRGVLVCEAVPRGTLLFVESPLCAVSESVRTGLARSTHFGSPSVQDQLLEVNLHDKQAFDGALVDRVLR